MDSKHYLGLAEGLDDMREMARAMVAGFMADGFTEKQARAITAGLFASMIDGNHEPVEE